MHRFLLLLGCYLKPFLSYIDVGTWRTLILRAALAATLLMPMGFRYGIIMSLKIAQGHSNMKFYRLSSLSTKSFLSLLREPVGT